MGRWWGPLAVLTLVAIGCLGLSFVTSVQQVRNLRAVGEVTAVAEGDLPGTVAVRVERDGRVTWWPASDDGEAGAPVGVPSSRPLSEDCTGQICYRVAGDALRVEASEDGGATYTVAWEVAEHTYAMLAATYPDLGDPAQHLSSRSVVVHDVAGGHVVFVANGRDGLLHRDESGVWHRLGAPASGEGCCYYLPPVRIPADPQPADLTVYAVVVVVLAILGSAGVALLFQRPRRFSGLLPVVALAALAGYGTELAGHFPAVGMFPGLLYGVPLILVILVVGITLAAWFVRVPGTGAVRQASDSHA